MQAATLYHNLHYNNRLQLVDIRVGDSSTDEWNWSRGALISYYGTAARDAWDPFKNSPDNNGNVLRQLHYVPLSGGGYVLPQLDDYNYDEVNRIKSVTEAQLNSSGGWTFNLFTQNFGYDRWGNRSVSCSPCQPGVTGDVFTIDAATNRITAKNGNGMTYDAAGNQTYDVTGNRWFDGENRMHKATQGGTTSHYVYDADGKRVRRIIGSTETWMIYGVDGELVAEYAAAASASSPQKEYGYRSGQMLIAAETSPLKITWMVTDHLGTPRMNIRGTGTDGGSLASVTRHDYLPFGEDLIAGIRVNGGAGQHGYEPPPDGVRQKFTGKERDNETGLDYFGARCFASAQGRFTSPDDYWKDSHVADPQSWNKYAYVRNNPLKYIDPSGEKATVTIETDEEHKRGRIKINASFAIWANSSNISQSDLQNAAASIKSTIEGAWTGTFEKDGITYTVETTIDVQVKGNEKDAMASGAQNVIELSDGPAIPGKSNSYVDPRPLLGGPDTGKWNIHLLTSDSGHEFTHLLGVGDRKSGTDLSNTNILNDSSISRIATANDYNWAFGGEIRSHRNGSRPYLKDPTAELGKGPQFVRGKPRSTTTTRILRTPFIWWR